MDIKLPWVYPYNEWISIDDKNKVMVINDTDAILLLDNKQLFCNIEMIPLIQCMDLNNHNAYSLAKLFTRLKDIDFEDRDVNNIKVQNIISHNLLIKGKSKLKILSKDKFKDRLMEENYLMDVPGIFVSIVYDIYADRMLELMEKYKFKYDKNVKPKMKIKKKNQSRVGKADTIDRIIFEILGKELHPLETESQLLIDFYDDELKFGICLEGDYEGELQLQNEYKLRLHSFDNGITIITIPHDMNSYGSIKKYLSYRFFDMAIDFTSDGLNCYKSL